MSSIVFCMAVNTRQFPCGKETRTAKDVVLQAKTENTVNRACERRGSSKENCSEKE